MCVCNLYGMQYKKNFCVYFQIIIAFACQFGTRESIASHISSCCCSGNRLRMSSLVCAISCSQQKLLTDVWLAKLVAAVATIIVVSVLFRNVYLFI